ncbi:MAG: hypothetical protein LCH54_15745 [Bacteroidetes bacterium]|nr:hypothetical protein [Bacteroidota bacterium]
MNRTCKHCGSEVCAMHRTPDEGHLYVCDSCNTRKVKTIQQGLFQTLVNDDLPQIKFTTNWNNKLACNCFTTIRPWNPDVYKIGTTYLIRHTDKNKSRDLMDPFKAELIAGNSFPLEKLPEISAALDTGYDRMKTMDIMRKMYENADSILFGIYLLRKVN